MCGRVEYLPNLLELRRARHHGALRPQGWGGRGDGRRSGHARQPGDQAKRQESASITRRGRRRVRWRNCGRVHSLRAAGDEARGAPGTAHARRGGARQGVAQRQVPSTTGGNHGGGGQAPHVSDHRWGRCHRTPRRSHRHRLRRTVCHRRSEGTRRHRRDGRDGDCQEGHEHCCRHVRVHQPQLHHRVHRTQ